MKVRGWVSFEHNQTVNFSGTTPIPSCSNEAVSGVRAVDLACVDVGIKPLARPTFPRYIHCLDNKPGREVMTFITEDRAVGPALASEVWKRATYPGEDCSTLALNEYYPLSWWTDTSSMVSAGINSAIERIVTFIECNDGWICGSGEVPVR